jgi:hypothetical protein
MKLSMTESRHGQVKTDQNNYTPQEFISRQVWTYKKRNHAIFHFVLRH